jgi:hypothetical protein
VLLVANYDFSLLKAYFAYGKDKGFNSAVLPNLNNPYNYAVAPKATTDSTDMLIGAGIPVGNAGTVMLINTGFGFLRRSFAHNSSVGLCVFFNGGAETSPSRASLTRGPLPRGAPPFVDTTRQ